ncbi:hypothetical protein AARAC_000780 [Aspergillus arachidicola]|uniref:Mid2 domain-containing protein n=1 Tax=Aspergillus arachidicola TaxID=656916 RepID=A0A2G7G4K2_9EURO|nr:hypothetical protein AARAC_000780 [Aspergillus arachidicola]
MGGLIVRWKHNSSHDPLEADFQIGQEGYNIVPHAIVKLNASSIAFEPEHVTRLLGPSASVRIWNADWIATSSVTELAKVSGFTLTAWTTLVSMTSSIPSTTTTRPGTITSTSVSNGSLSTTEQPKTNGDANSDSRSMLEESSQGLSTSAKAGIGVGVSVGAIMIIVAAAFFLVRNRRKQADRGDVRAELPATSTSKKVAVVSEPAELQSTSTTKHEFYELPV